MNLNKVFLFGNLTRDPEVRALPSGQPVVNFSIATNRMYTDKQGQRQQEVEFHNIVAYSKSAEIIQQYAKKGSSMLIEGRIKTRSWDGQDGKKNYKTEIIVDNFQFGPRTQSSGGQGYSKDSATNAPPPKASGDKQPQEEIETIEYPEDTGDEVNPDDIPF